MLERIMVWMILGHFIGDYLLQSKKTALGKSAPGWRGALTCVWHCYLYTMAVYVAIVLGLGSILLPPGLVLALPMIFLTHYPIDRWSLADKWSKMIGGRRLRDQTGPLDYDSRLPPTLGNMAAVSTDQAFAAIVYTVVDNTMHILLMTAGFAALLYWGVL